MSSQLRLDDLYKMVAHIYSEQNAYRSASATFGHFVEVCGTLTVESRGKRRERLTFEDALCKSLGWYFPLLAKFKVTSVEDLVYRKYPYVCPYCREVPHAEMPCKTIRGTDKTVDHESLRQYRQKNAHRRPESLAQWQLMFREIYPRNMQDIISSHSVLGLFEELGEMAEAIRVFDTHPKYFVGEAADVFSYLMGLANEYALKQSQARVVFSLEDEFIRRYPGLCVQCGHAVCVCPVIPESTVGRLAKELEIEDVERLFSLDLGAARKESAVIASRALARAGGYAGVIDQFPFDRGDINKALIMFCLRAAEEMNKHNISVAESFRSAAIRIGAAATYAGSKRSPAEIEGVISSVKAMLDALPKEVQKTIGAAGQPLEVTIGGEASRPFREPEFFEAMPRATKRGIDS